VPLCYWHVLRLGHLPENVNDVEGLSQANEVAVVRDGSRALATGTIAYARRSCYGRENDIPTTDPTAAHGVARDQSDLGRNGSERDGNKSWIKAHHLGGLINLCTGCSEGLATSLRKDAHALALEDSECGEMQAFGLIF
jgi:hypothetical protein